MGRGIETSSGAAAVVFIIICYVRKEYRLVGTLFVICDKAREGGGGPVESMRPPRPPSGKQAQLGRLIAIWICIQNPVTTESDALYPADLRSQIQTHDCNGCPLSLTSKTAFLGVMAAPATSALVVGHCESTCRGKGICNRLTQRYVVEGGVPTTIDFEIVRMFWGFRLMDNVV